jgi:hypothetical protein
MTHPDLARYHALLTEAHALARSLFWRVMLTAETVDAIAERLRALLVGRAFIMRDSVQVYPRSRLKGITIGRCEEFDEAWVDLFVQMENGPRFTFSTAAYGMYSAPVFCFGSESVTIERVKLARPPYGYPQRIVFAIEEEEHL